MCQKDCDLKKIKIRNIRVSKGKAQQCEKTCSCSNLISDYVIDKFRNISKSSDCQTLCIQNSNCNFYTYYDSQTGR